MKKHSNEFKQQLIALGREQDIQVKYNNITLNSEQINSATISYNGGLLKSVMKALEIEVINYIPIGTELKLKWGLKVEDKYEYLDFGTFIVKEAEVQEDKKSILLTCYDKMLYSMKDYEELNITYPTTLKNYIKGICNKIDIEFANEYDTFANFNREIASDVYKGIGYTFRDVLDEIAEATASCIVINEDDKLEIRYPTENNYIKTVQGNSIEISDSISNNIDKLEIDGNTLQNGTPTPTNPIDLENLEGQNELGGFYYTKTFGSGLTFTYKEDGTITINGTSTATGTVYSTLQADAVNMLKSLKAGTYQLGTGEIDIRLQIIKSVDGAYSTLKGTDNTHLTTSFTITEPVKYYYRLAVYNSNGKTFNNKVIKCSLVKSNETKPYLPYNNIGILQNKEKLYSIDLKGNTLKGLETFKDKLLINSQGEVIIEKWIEEIELNGTENIIVNQTSTNNWYYDFSNFINKEILQYTDGNKFAKCTHYPTTQIYSTNTNQGFFVSYANDNPYLRIRYGEEDTVDNFKTWLSINKPKVQFILAEPEYINLGKINPIELNEGSNTFNLLANIENNISISYVYDTETINENFIKNTNANFGEKYGPINSIVLSRAESDNIYIQDEESIENNGLCELKIVDNQLMNHNDRSDYLPDLLNKLNGIQYCINDYSSTGICYLEPMDYYTVQIGEDKYKCLMINDEIDITQGIEEQIYAEIPEIAETDYSKADKTDRRINQTTLMVDKQNQSIESMINTVSEQNNKIALISSTVDELNSKISDVADITVSAESAFAKVELSNINQSEPIYIKIHPIVENITKIYPNNSLYPNNTNYPKTRILRFTNKKTDEILDYELPDDLLYYNQKNYDEFELSYEEQICRIHKVCEYNIYGDVIPKTEEWKEYDFPKINLTDGNYSIELISHNNGYLYITLMSQNIYTTQFATKAELSSELSQTAQEINLNVNKKLELYPTTTEMNSAISITAAGINSEVIKKVGKTEVVSTINQSADEINLRGNRIIIDSDNFKLDKNGNMECHNSKIYGDIISTSASNIVDTEIQINDLGFLHEYIVKPGLINRSVYIQKGGITLNNNLTSQQTIIVGESVTTPKLIQTSKESTKKNFEKIDTVMNIIKNSEIYKYNLKDEDDINTKHYGFVIPDNGGKFITPKEVVSKDNQGIDIYSMASILWKSVQEQQEMIEKLKERIEKLEGTK